MSDFPELERMKAVSADSQKIGVFIDWLRSQDIHLCRDVQYGYQSDYVPIRETPEKLLAAYFEIDLNKVEEERQRLFNQLNEKK